MDDAPPMRIAAVVVTAFPPELQAWIARLPLPEMLPFPQGAEPSRAPLRLNRERRVLGVTTGMRPTRAAISLLALGHDARFDLSAAYWVVAGIAGVDPAYGSIGSVFVPRRLVGLGGDIYLDGVGQIPYFGNHTMPGYGPPLPTAAYAARRGNVHALHSTTVDMALALASGVVLNDSARLQRARQPYTEASARERPRVREGDSLTGPLFWAGRASTLRARRGSRFWSGGGATFAVSQEEDLAIAHAIGALERATPRPRANASRLVVLRAASDYTYEPRGADLKAWFFDDPLHMVATEAFSNLFAAGEPLLRHLAPESAGGAEGGGAAAGESSRRGGDSGLFVPWPALLALALAQAASAGAVLLVCVRLRNRRASTRASGDGRKRALQWLELDEPAHAGGRA